MWITSFIGVFHRLNMCEQKTKFDRENESQNLKPKSEVAIVEANLHAMLT